MRGKGQGVDCPAGYYWLETATVFIVHMTLAVHRKKRSHVKLKMNRHLWFGSITNKKSGKKSKERQMK